MYSIDGFKYYVIFVDHHTKYIWFYSIKNKSNTKALFIRYKARVQKYFNTPIKVLCFYNGRAYEALASFLTINDIFDLTSPLHTREYNGFVERRHHHILEIGLSLLITHAPLPLTYWS